MSGDVTGPATFVAVNVTRGISKPLLVLEISSIEDDLGTAPFVLMLTCVCAFSEKETMINSNSTTWSVCFIFYQFSGIGKAWNHDKKERLGEWILRVI